jgi:DNA polymerase-1
MPLVTTHHQVSEVLTKLEHSPLFYLDCETDGLEIYDDKRLCGIALKAAEDATPYYLPFRHPGQNLPLDDLAKIGKVLADPKKTWSNWNIEFDMGVLMNEGLDINCRVRCSRVAAHLSNENEYGPVKHFALKPWAKKYIDPHAADAQAALKEHLGGAGYIHEYPADNELVLKYVYDDVIYAEQAMIKCMRKLGRDGLTDLYAELEDYVRANQFLVSNGLLVDVEALERGIDEKQAEQERIVAELERVVGRKFNPNSHIQVKDYYGIPHTASADKEFLEDRFDDPATEHILKYRQATKAIGSFYKPLLNFRDKNNRVHAGIDLCGTVSSRPSCSNPNLQALPREGDTYDVRSKIIAPPGHSILSSDYSQAELRLLAHYSRSPYLLHAYENDLDIHRVMSDMLSIDRDWAKRLNFGCSYGLGADGFARQARLSKAKALVVYERFHDAMPEISRLRRRMEGFAKADGFIKLWTGRRRRYREEHHKAMSGLIQGGVAEMMRVGMCRVYKLAKQYGFEIVLQVHDDIIMYVPDELVSTVAPLVKAALEDFNFAVPIKCELKVGKTWGKMTKL